MRHFLRLALAPSALPGGVRIRPAVAALVAPTGAAQGLAPAQLPALPRAVAVAAVALTADAHLHRAAPAAVQPIGLLACPHAPRTQHWTTPRIAGIKAGRTRPQSARARRRPGVLPGTCPGLRLFGVQTQHSARAAPSYAGPALGSHRERRLNGRRRLVQPHGAARHARIPSETKPLARANSAVNNSGGAARQSPKSRGFTSPLTPPDSAAGATLDTGGWLALTRPGLSPGKIRQAYLGATTFTLRRPQQQAQRRCCGSPAAC